MHCDNKAEQALKLAVEKNQREVIAFNKSFMIFIQTLIEVENFK